MSGGLYRSAHTAPDGDPQSPDDAVPDAGVPDGTESGGAVSGGAVSGGTVSGGAFFVPVDGTGTIPTAAGDQALPPEVIPPTPYESSGGGTVYGSHVSGRSSGAVYGGTGAVGPDGPETSILDDVAADRAALGTAAEAPDEERSTTGNSVIMAIGSFVSRIIGFVRNMLIGMTLGTAVGDAYTSAQFLPGQIYELLLGGILSSVLIPLLVRRRKEDADGGQLFTQRLLTFSVVSLGIATLLITVAAPAITLVQSSGDSSEGYRGLVTALAYLILPIIFFTGLSAIIASVLNVRGSFAAPMYTPILNSLVIIAACGLFIWIYGPAGPDLAELSTGEILLISGATLLGIVVQTVGLLPALRKVGFRWKWRWAPKELELGEVGRLAGWVLCYVVANQLAIFLVVRLLSGVSDGVTASVLAYNNVFLLTMMAHGIIGVSVMTALLPRMSAAAADGRFADVSEDLSRGIRLVTTALAPISVIYGVLGRPIAVTLFQGGGLNYDAAFATGDVLVAAAFAVIPLSISYLCTSAFYALQGTKTVALINLPVVVLRIVGYLVFAEVLSASLAAAGMTAVNAVSYLLAAVISLVVLRRQIGRLNLASVGKALVKVLVATGIATVAGLLIVQVLPGGDTPGRIEAAVQVVAGGAVIVLAYLLSATLLKVQEVSQVVGMVRRKLGR